VIKKIKVLAYEYKVKQAERMAERFDADAQHDPVEGVIWFDSRLKNRPENDIMHEVFESIKWQLEYDKDKFSHQVLTAVSNMVCAVLRDNPEFTRMFL